MRVLQLLFAVVVILLLQGAPGTRGLSDSQQCRSNRGRCRRLCFHMERWEGNCSNGRQRCCR
ncbi:gallinacin-13-like [Chamaea fasciata]|uniref:gallinacin-13-like n=1 Tax=Chamaea fasciata TaxID=190680 RepID=UPI003369E838